MPAPFLDEIPDLFIYRSALQQEAKSQNSPRQIIKMSNPKLRFLKKKFHKFFKQTFLFEIWKETSESKNRMFQLYQGRTSRNLFRRKSASEVKALASAFRYPYVRIQPNLLQRFRALQASKVLWKVLLPHVSKDEKARKSVWVAVTNGAFVPRLTRGFAKATDVAPPGTHGKVEGRPVRAEPQDSGGAAEQKLYTTDVSPIKFYSLKRQREEDDVGEGETFSAELPPSQRCRLSCPLPPPEFFPPEKLAFLPNHQPPSVRFAALQSEFLPPQRPAQGKAYAMKNRDRPASDRPRALATEGPRFPEYAPHGVKPNKNYFNLKNGKSQLYRPPQSDTVPKMRALLFEPIALSLNYDVVRAPNKIYKDEVLVQVAFSGVCGSDLYMTEGKVFCGEDPIILGHEISGQVYAVGSDVQHVEIGDNIAVNPYTACSICRYCSRGLFSACLNEGLNNSIGVSKNGGWAEFVVVKKSQVHKIPEGLGLDQAALILPLSCVLSAMSKLKLSQDMKILIQGLGLPGCLWASVLHSRGYKDVLVTDKNPKKKKRFESLGLNYSFVPPEDVGQLAVDVVVECTGSPVSIERAFNVLSESGQMCFFGTPNPATQVRCIPYDIIQKEITIFGRAGNSFCFTEAVDVAASLGPRYLDLSKLGVRIFNLEDYREAFRLKKSGEVGKIVFKLDS